MRVSTSGVFYNSAATDELDDLSHDDVKFKLLTPVDAKPHIETEAPTLREALADLISEHTHSWRAGDDVTFTVYVNRHDDDQYLADMHCTLYSPTDETDAITNAVQTIFDALTDRLPQLPTSSAR